jgi:hypothetical protein
MAGSAIAVPVSGVARGFAEPRGHGWRGVSFVSSSKDILARCMREKGVPASAAAAVLAGLPDTFKQLEAASVASARPAWARRIPGRTGADALRGLRR